MAPQRIQLRRTRGWRLPAGAIVVSRPSRWGNPFKVGYGGISDVRPVYQVRDTRVRGTFFSAREALDCAIWLYRVEVVPYLDLAELAGHDLACWCPLNRPCHADALLELANKETNDGRKL